MSADKQLVWVAVRSDGKKNTPQQPFVAFTDERTARDFIDALDAAGGFGITLWHVPIWPIRNSPANAEK